MLQGAGIGLDFSRLIPSSSFIHSTNTLKKKKKKPGSEIKSIGALESDCLGRSPSTTVDGCWLLTSFLSCKMRGQTLLLRRVIGRIQ